VRLPAEDRSEVPNRVSPKVGSTEVPHKLESPKWGPPGLSHRGLRLSDMEDLVEELHVSMATIDVDLLQEVQASIP
jgi:hypothetical protein